MRKRKRLVFRIKTILVVLLAKLRTVLPVRVLSEAVPHVAIEPEVMEEVVALENAVVLYDPMVPVVDEGLENRRREIRVIGAGKGVPDVVKQSAHDVFVIASIALGTCSGLKAVSKTIYRVAPRVA